MKIKNVLMISFLAIAGIFGVSSAIVNNEAKETPVVEKAEAATTESYYLGNKWHAYAWNKSTGTKYLGEWPGTEMTWYSVDGTDHRRFTVDTRADQIIFTQNGGSQTDDLAYSSTSPFYNDSGKYNTGELLYIYSDNASLNNTAFTFNSSTRNFTLSTGVLQAGTKVKFYGQNFRPNVWCSGKNLTGFNSARDSSGNYVVTASGSFTFTCTALGYATESDFTNAMTSTFTPAPTYTVTYNYYNTNGTSVKNPTSSGSQQAGTTITLPNTPGISVSGYKFYGWYTNYSSGLFSGTHYDGGASYTVNANVTLYAKYVTADKGYVLGTFNDWNEVTAATMTDNSPSSGLRSFVRSFSVNDKFYIRYVNSNDNDGIYHYSNLGSGGDAGHNFTSDNDDNFVCSTAGTYMIVLDTGAQGNYHVQIYYSPYKDLGYYMAGSGSFGNWSLSSAKPMTADPSGNNTAILENGTTGISVTANSVLQVWNHSSVSSLTKYSMTLGGSYTFARDDGDNITITATGNYNFYFKIDEGTNYLYIVDVGEIANAGTLYLTSPQGTIGSITITTTNTKSEHQFNGVALSNVTGVVKESSTLKFGDGYVYSIPIFNLRGNDSSSPCTVVVLSWSAPSSGSVTLNDVDDLGGSAQHYYIDRSGTTGTASESKYIGLKVALDIDAAIQATPNTSVCEVDADTASALCERYDNVTVAQGSSTLAVSTIHTWAKVKGDSGDDIPMSSIRIELGNRSGDPKYSSAIRSFNPFSLIGDDSGDNATTIIIIIAASVSLLSITALSILLVKKRKRVDN